jgi:hypothetical protein
MRCSNEEEQAEIQLLVSQSVHGVATRVVLFECPSLES